MAVMDYISDCSTSNESGRAFVLKDLFYGTSEHKSKSGTKHDKLGIQGSGFDGDKYKLDLYIPKPKISLPTEANSTHLQKTPIVLFVHGGGWRRGDRSAWKHYISVLDTNILIAFILKLFKLYGNIGEAFAERGIACAVISYPLSKLEMPWMLFEMLTSYLMSSVFLLGIAAVFAFSGCIFMGLLGFPFLKLTHFNLVHIILLSLTLVNLIYLLIMTLLKNRYKLTSSNVLLLWSLTMMSILGFHSFEESSEPHMLGLWRNYLITFSVFLSTLVWTQGMLLYKRLQVTTFSYKEQLKAVKHSAVFVKEFGEQNNLYDGNELYLMGHSAGGHLVTLLALQTARANESKSDLIIKGVISISGVFDLPKLDKKVLKPLYLHPTFGENHSDWIEASPSHIMTSTNVTGFHHHMTEPSNKIPPFLLITAEKDLHLQTDAEILARQIQEIGGNCSLETICPSNHFTIVWDFKANPAEANTKLTQVCVDFILPQVTVVPQE